MNSDMMRAATPLFLAGMGGVIAIAAILQSSNLPSDRFALIGGIAGGAITGAAGLAQSVKQE
jgi:hypothetical protein